MAKILDGKKVAVQIKEELKKEVQQWQQKGINPCMGVILVGEDPASRAYAKFLEKVANGVDIKFQLEKLPSDVSEDDLLQKIDSLNHAPFVQGILQLLPLPKYMDKKTVMDAILPAKDVDGMHPINRGYILSGGECIYPATPLSCLEILHRSGYSLAGKNVVIVGRGETVGKPLMYMAVAEDATVTVCHSRTTDLAYHTKQADIVISAVGKPNLITGEMLKPGAVVVDAGISEVNGKICGDIDFESVSQVAEAVSPVPGGVGSITTSMMLKNLLKGISMQKAIRNSCQ